LQKIKEGIKMQAVLNNLTIDEFKLIIADTVKESMNECFEDIIALNSESYVNSIKEAREDFQNNKVKSFEELFDV